MSKDYRDYIQDILTSVELINSFIKGLSLNDFKEDVKTSSAVIRQLEVMGEAAKNIPENIKEKYTDIPWKKICGMRDKLIHEYFGVDYEIVWKTIKEKLSPLKPLLEKVKLDIEKNTKL